MSHEECPTPEGQGVSDAELEVVTENIEAEIARLIERLGDFDFDRQSEDVQDEWYYVEQEANTGADRAQAKSRLEALISKLTE